MNGQTTASANMMPTRGPGMITDRPMTEEQAAARGINVEEVKANAEVLPEAPVEQTTTENTTLPPEYVEAGNTEYSGTSEMGRDVGRGFDASAEQTEKGSD